MSCAGCLGLWAGWVPLTQAVDSPGQCAGGAAGVVQAFGCGLHQGEVFGFAVEDIDFKGGWIHVNRQVRLVGTKAVFALPKGSGQCPCRLNLPLPSKPT